MVAPTETYSFTAEQVLQDIQQELINPPPEETPILQTIAEIRAAQKQLRTSPVIGKMAGLKQFFYNMNNSTFSRQFNQNELLLDLIEELYQELYQYKQAQFQLFVQPQDTPQPGVSGPTGDLHLRK